MADEYIRREDAVNALAKTMPTPATPDGAGEFDHEIHIADEAFADAIRIIESLEPADVVPVVRCRDCKHLGTFRGKLYCRHNCGIVEQKENDFCSRGERKE